MSEEEAREIVRTSPTTIQEEIAFLKRRAWDTTDPVLKFNHYRDLIAAGLQAVDEEEFRGRIADELGRLNFDDGAYRERASKGQPLEAVERLHYAGRLTDLMMVWDKVAVKLTGLGVIEVKRQGTEESVEGRRPGGRWKPSFLRAGSSLLAASVILLTTNVLLLVAAVLGVLGSEPGGLDAGMVAYVALGIGPIGVALFGWCFWRLSREAEGRLGARRRLAALLFFAWVGLTVVWRYALPAAMGTDYQTLFFSILSIGGTVPSQIEQNLGLVSAILGLWVLSGAVFLGAHVAVWVGQRDAADSDWARELPWSALLLAAAISLLGTVLLAHSMASQLAGGPIGNFFAGSILKLVIAPNVFISAYALSLRLSWDAAQEGRVPRDVGVAP